LLNNHPLEYYTPSDQAEETTETPVSQEEDDDEIKQ